MNFEEKHRIASDKYHDGQKLTLEEVMILGIHPNDAFSADSYDGDSLTKCPDGCGGTLVIQKSRNGYGPYIGCNNSRMCSYYTTVKRLKELKEKLIKHE